MEVKDHIFAKARDLAGSASADNLSEIQRQVFTLALDSAMTEAEVEVLIKDMASATGIPESAFRKTWKILVSDDSDTSAKITQSQSLIKLCSDLCFFCDNASDEAYVKVRVGDHYEVYNLRTREFKMLLSKLFYEAEGKPPGTQALQDTLGILEAKARFDFDPQPVYYRLAERDGTIYIDIGDDKWRVIEIDDQGWRILDESPIMFRRSKNTKALPVPMPGGRVNRIRDFVNVSEEEYPLLLAFLVACLYPKGPYPILNIQAEQGSGKSSQARTIKSLVDPSSAPLRSAPRDERDLLIATKHNRVIALDNLSNISGNLSDGLCRLSTGGGYATRALYSDNDENIIEAMCPVILTGITDIATQSDLLDRTIVLHLPRLPESQRKTEAALNAEFSAASPFIFGALLDAVSSGLRTLPTVHIEAPPRMADFAVWATACEVGLGLEPGSFLKAYRENRSQANTIALEESLVSVAFQKFAESLSDPWEGSMSELLTNLESFISDNQRKTREWPKAANSLSMKLKRLAPNLRLVGIEVEIHRSNRGSRVSVQKTVTTVTPSPDGEYTRTERHLSGEGSDDSYVQQDTSHFDRLHQSLSAGQKSDDGYVGDDVLRPDSEDELWL
ncbi:MAG: DUF2249 domain-containing protein [Trueperaceae bacterium]|nr:DUF2249 domain-containing protein [Trueperaceae bacterium]